MDQEQFEARPFGRTPWSYERRKGKQGKPDHYVLNDADGRYLGTVVLGSDTDDEQIARMICKAVNGAEDARRAMDRALAYLEDGITMPDYDGTKADLVAARKGLNGKGG